MPQANWTQEHVARYIESGGADGHIWTGHDGKGDFPCLLLTTSGRKSGERRVTPLIYGRDGDDYVIIASQGGRPNHPAWYFNLDADAKVGVQVQADVFAASARTAGAGDRDRLWKMMAQIYPPYDEYQVKAASREIPVVVLSRV